MSGKVLKADASAGIAFVATDFTSCPEVWVTFGCLLPAAAITLWTATGNGAKLLEIDSPIDSGTEVDSLWLLDGATYGVAGDPWRGESPPETGSAPPPTPDAWQTFEFHYDNGVLSEFFINELPVWSASPVNSLDVNQVVMGLQTATPAGGPVYFDDVLIGTTRGGSDIFHDDFESGDLSAWSTTTGDVSVVDDPDPAPISMWPGRRVGIAFDDDPFEPNPTWKWLDGTDFPVQFVSGYDTKNGRQGLISQTETGTATVYVNDHEDGLFDDRNVSSPYHGKLSGRQVLLQLWDPVAAVWEEEFRGLVETYSYDIDGSAVDANGDPINASIQIECVDMFDYLNGYGLTPGLDGIVPPAGMEDGVYYAATSGTVDGRIVEILTDAKIDPAMWIVASGNVKVVGVKYDPDESALAALRDAADAELPFIANIYVNRHGQFAFRGRYSRFDPDAVVAEPGSDWDFARWPVGDGKAIAADSTRAQMRVLSFERSRPDLINAAMAYPQGIPAVDMPNQVYANTTSINKYGKQQAAPMSDLLTAQGVETPDAYNANKETFLFAKLLVKNQAEPRESVTALQLKALPPDDPRAAVTWATITRADISHIVNVAVGYPGGTGFVGDSPKDDYYIEGRQLKVRPLNPTHDYVELDLAVSPAVWSMDTHGVFPPFSGPAPITAGFDYLKEPDAGEFSFTDNSTPGPSGPITAWAWDFGDGGTDTVENPVYVYAANGTYEVVLTVTGTGGDGTDSEHRPVKVSDVP